MNTTKGYKCDYHKVMSELKAKISFALVRRNAWLSERRRLQTLTHFRYDLKIEGDLTAFSILSWVEGDFNPPFDRRVVIIPFLGGRHLSVGDLISTGLYRRRQTASRGRGGRQRHRGGRQNAPIHRIRLSVVELLLSSGASPKADVNLATTDGMTPLFIASEFGHLEVVERLLSAGAKVDLATTDDGSSPLFIASQRGHLQIVERLLSAGAEVNRKTYHDVPPVYVACQEGHLAVVARLRLAGADLDCVIDDGSTPLFIASQRGHLPVVDLLLSADDGRHGRGRHGPLVNQATIPDGSTPLIIAACEGHLSVVERLLSAGANVNHATTDRGETSLLLSCRYGHVEIVLALLRRGADVDLADFYLGMRPIDYVCGFGHDRCLQALLSYNADFAAAGGGGASGAAAESPGHRAYRRGHHGCLEILRRWPVLRNQVAVKLCISDLKRNGGYETVNAVHINELSGPMFVFKVLEEMKSRKMYGLPDQLVEYIGTGERHTDDYEDFWEDHVWDDHLWDSEDGDDSDDD